MFIVFLNSFWKIAFWCEAKAEVCCARATQLRDQETKTNNHYGIFVKTFSHKLNLLKKNKEHRLLTDLHLIE